MEAKDSAVKQATEAEDAAKANVERVGELSEEIASVRDSILQVKLASKRAKEEETMICADKDKQKLLALKKDIDPELVKNLETELGKTLSEVERLGDKIDNARATDLDAMKTVTTEMDVAKESLRKAAEEDKLVRSLVESLRLELSNMKKEHFELKEKEAETEAIAGNLHVRLRKAKSELEEAKQLKKKPKQGVLLRK